MVIKMISVEKYKQKNEEIKKKDERDLWDASWYGDLIRIKYLLEEQNIEINSKQLDEVTFFHSISFSLSFSLFLFLSGNCFILSILF